MSRPELTGRAAAWALARYAPKVFAIGASFIVVWWTLPVVLGLLLQRVFDRIADGQDVASALTSLTVVELVRMALLYAFIAVWVRWWVTALTLLRGNLLRAQLASGGDEAGPPVSGSGAAITVFRNDVEDLVLYLDTWLDVAGTTGFAVAALAIMLRVDARVTLVVIVPLLVAFAVNVALADRLRAYRRADREATAVVTGFLGALFSAVLAVKVAGAERASLARLHRSNVVRGQTAVRDRVLAESVEALSGSTVDLSIGLVLLLASGAMRSGAFTVGDLALFITYLPWLAALPRWAGRLLTRQRHAEVGVSRMTQLVPPAAPGDVVAHRSLRLDPHAPTAPRARPASEAPADVRLRAVGHTYPGGGGVHAIDLQLPPGSFTVLCGPVGSGKTTLLQALLGLLTPSEGTVEWNGRAVPDRAAHMVPPRAAYLAQVPRLFSATLGENVLLGVETPEQEAAEVLHRAAFETDFRRLNDGLATMIGPRGVRLSGGQVQRAATARALAGDAALLVLDDLSSALDAHTERTLWSRLLDDRRHPTCLVVSHRAAALERADQIVLLEAGRVRAVGTLDELRSRGLDPLATPAT